MTEIPDLFDFEFVNIIIIIIIIFVILPKRLRTTQKTDEDYIFICDFKITIVIFFKFCKKKCDYNREEGIGF